MLSINPDRHNESSLSLLSFHYVQWSYVRKLLEPNVGMETII